MSTSKLFSDSLRDPLNETTRKTRRNLLAASLAGLVIAKVGLIPTKISAFGIEFSADNQQSLVMLLALVIAYFAAAFFVYSYSEFTAWQLAFRSQELQQLEEGLQRTKNILQTDEEIWFHKQAERTYYQARPTFIVRIFVEFVVPVCFAGYVVVSLITTELPTQDALNNKTQPVAEAVAD